MGFVFVLGFGWPGDSRKELCGTAMKFGCSLPREPQALWSAEACPRFGMRATCRRAGFPVRWRCFPIMIRRVARGTGSPSASLTRPKAVASHAHSKAALPQALARAGSFQMGITKLEAVHEPSVHGMRARTSLRKPSEYQTAAQHAKTHGRRRNEGPAVV